MQKKKYLPQGFMILSGFKLGRLIVEAKMRPKGRLFMMGVRRGGPLVAAGVHEFYKYKRTKNKDMPFMDYFFDLTAQGYVGIGSGNMKKDLTIRGIEYVSNNLGKDDILILVDDLWDTGRTFDELTKAIRDLMGENAPEIRIATVFFKPKMNKSKSKPDFYLYETNDWIVMFYEIDGISEDEIKENKKDIHDVFVSKDFKYPKKF